MKAKVQSSINQRSDKSEVVFRGIVPQEYLEDDAEIAAQKVKESRQNIKQTFNQRYTNRKPADELRELLSMGSPMESNPVPQPYQPSTTGSLDIPDTSSYAVRGIQVLYLQHQYDYKYHEIDDQTRTITITITIFHIFHIFRQIQSKSERIT